MLNPVARYLILATCLISSSGCESLKLIAERIANRPDAGSAPASTTPRSAGTTAGDSAQPATAATASAEAAPRSRKARVSVLDPDGFAQAASRHLQELIRASATPLAPAEVGYYMDVQNAQLVQMLHPTSIDIRYESDFIILTMPGGESFEHDSARLESAARESLNLTSRILLEYAQTRITIHGHTDETGEAAYNQLLSVRRALSVADQLLTAGIAAERIAVVGFGESRPLTRNAMPAERARNRRIELYLEPIAR